jgi:hypothetical protein
LAQARFASAPVVLPARRITSASLAAWPELRERHLGEHM